MTRILIADAHLSIRRAVRSVAGYRVEVVGEAATAAEAIASTTALSPRVVLLDADLPGMSTIELAHQLRRSSDDVKLIIASTYESTSLAARFRDAGANAYLLKPDLAMTLVDCLDAINDGFLFFNDRLLPNIRQEVPHTLPASAQLTVRESEVVKLLASGQSNKEIAQVLQISINTVETHRARIMRKLELHSMTALVRYAIKSQLIDI